MYYTTNGAEVSRQQIETAFQAGQARLVYSWGRDGRTLTALALDGQDIDSRGQCWSVYDESWTAKPKTFWECVRAAK